MSDHRSRSDFNISFIGRIIVEKTPVHKRRNPKDMSRWPVVAKWVKWLWRNGHEREFTPKQ
jgi:hypothetical protein